MGVIFLCGGTGVRRFTDEYWLVVLGVYYANLCDDPISRKKGSFFCLPSAISLEI